MKEIKVTDHSTIPHIVGDQMTVEVAKRYCMTSSKYCMIVGIIHDRGSLGRNKWFQLIHVDDSGIAFIHEQSNNNTYFGRVGSGVPIEDYLANIMRHYPESEYYLVENFGEIFQIIKERMPGWLPQ